MEIQVFSPHGIGLDDRNRLRYYKARPTPVQDTGQGFFVAIRTTKGKRYVLYNLRRSDPVWHLKACIQDVLGVSGLKQELAFLGKEISDGELTPHKRKETRTLIIFRQKRLLVHTASKR